MKKFINKIKISTVLLFAVIFNSCDLDINENPNSATGSVVTPDLTLAAVIASTVYNQIYYYGYASAAYWAGFQVPGSGIAGFGEQYTYNITSSSVTGAWTAIDADLRQYNTIIKKAEADEEYALYGGICHIMKAYCFQLLVDAYADVPYSEGLQGKEGIYTPAFDKGADVYKALVAEIDEAISIINANKGNIGVSVKGLNSTSDPVFSGDMTKWVQFANNLKLRLLVRAEGSEIDAFVKESFGKFSSDGFLKQDVLVNPGYNATSAQNPYWSVYHSSVTGSQTQAAQYYVPSRYVFSFYNGTKLLDSIRGKLVYKGYPSTPSGQLGIEVDGDLHPTSNRYAWYVGTGTGTSASEAKGIIKSRAAPTPLFTLTETYFLLAEAALNGHTLDGDAKTNFEKGIEASIGYLSISGTGTAYPSTAAADFAQYKADNATKYLVNFDLADTNAKKLEAIITQKYLALNMINSNEAWNEFRRTAYPTLSGNDDPVYSFVSVQSNSTHHDRLPVKLVWPQNEINLNPNVPKDRDPYQDRVFWDKQ
ncbi:MAG: SusD/RagB family nutrient-binding outer membrane lipoprotein [Dysgonamonadaceae bacterium]|jgi:hypothetical protein|nr:SusD/RagB family nutrient-binding outer membrane lipoprotein [Dysgonamonadaceae bacterium]